MSARGELAAFLRAVRTVESNGDYRARNTSGATGAYQFLDDTWAGYGRWDVVAVAWHGGPGLADRARRDPSILHRVGDGSITTAEYVRRVIGRVRPGRADRPGGTVGRYGDPWRRPCRGLPLAGRTVSIDPDGLHRLARRLDTHLSTVEESLRRCRREVGELGSVVVADGQLQVLLREALDRVVDDPDGLRRLPYLLSRDVAYVLDVRRRVLHADRPDTRVRPGAGPTAGVRPIARVRLGRSWAGTKSIFDQFVTPFLRRYGLRPGTRKWANPNTGSDHRPEHTSAYAIDFPTRAGLGAARALARAMGIRGWRPDTYGRPHVKVDGVWFRVQILWGARIDHADHVHVGIRRL